AAIGGVRGFSQNLVASRVNQNNGPDRVPNDVSVHQAYMSKALGLLKAAVQEFSGGRLHSLERRIILMSALLIRAELACDPSLTLYTHANDCFEHGTALYRAIETEIEKNRDHIEAEISKNPEVAMRLDAVRVRWKRIDDRR